MGFKNPRFNDRRSDADAAKKALLEKFRASADDPSRQEQDAKRLAIHSSRLSRSAAREAAKKAAEAKLAAEDALQAELEIQAAREAEQARECAAAAEIETAMALKAEQKAERDARYAARKAAKKVRRRGL